MKLYFQPLASSMATRIVLSEANIAAEFIKVDKDNKEEFAQINPTGLVPALQLEDGKILLENIAILQYVAGLNPEARLLTEKPFTSAQLCQWLSFISVELHKGIFSPLLNVRVPNSVKEWVVHDGQKAMNRLAGHLEGRKYLLEHFTVADAYLTTVLHWAQVTPIKLSKWPSIDVYFKEQMNRTSVSQAISIELPLYLEEQKSINS